MNPTMNDAVEMLIDFRLAGQTEAWRGVDDRVMGGVSHSRLESTEEGTAAFRGDLSLDQGGGFASVRCDFDPRDLSRERGIALRVRGDGRTYKLRLRDRLGAGIVDHQARFETVPGVWSTVLLPFDSFVPTSRGRVVPGAEPLDLRSVTTIGLLVSDRQEGRFELEIEWIGTFGTR
jgi:monofunctional biosynthetic peptidoglycan transglycosylase